MKTFPLLVAIAASAAGLSGGIAHAAPPVETKSTPENGRTFDERAIVHVLNRLAFGPRPGDVAALRDQGVIAWIDAQLAPETLEDRAVEAKLEPLATLRLSQSQLLNAYDADRAFGQMRKAETQKAGDAPVKTLNARQKAAAAEGTRNGFQVGIGLQALGESQTARLVRAVESKRQLQENLVDFWSNHFNLDARKGPVRTLRIADEREVIRPHVLGKFREMLGASAKSPAMLFYLDNFRSTQATEIRRPLNRKDRAAKKQVADAEMMEAAIPKKMRGGINENYARELMELHTLGVGGYSQKDVQEVARCFTGWSFSQQSGEFEFRPRAHDNGAKVVLGRAIPAGGGIRDGETVLDILAQSPATARHLARRLSQRFVADEPPPALVERAAQVFLKTGGDLKAVTRAVVTSPEFFAATSSKIKSPFEFAASAVRALGGTVAVPNPGRPRERQTLIDNGATSLGRNNARARATRTLPRELALMGQPFFAFQAPTGYPEDSRTWVSAGALVARLNFALALAGGQMSDVHSPQIRLEGQNAAARVQNLARTLLGTPLSATTQATIEKQVAPAAGMRPVSTHGSDAQKICALILGSPEFQRR